MKILKKVAEDAFGLLGLVALAWLLGFSMMSGGIVAASYHDVAVVIAYEEAPTEEKADDE
jgi:hypothetical protein